MARRRMIVPELWTDEGFIMLSYGARLLFLGMINFADDFGKGMGDARCLKVKIFPMDSLTIDEINSLKKEVEQCVHVKFYSVNGKEYYLLERWDLHQTIPRKFKSSIPNPISVHNKDNINTHQVQDIDITYINERNKETNKERKKQDSIHNLSTTSLVDNSPTEKAAPPSATPSEVNSPPFGKDKDSDRSPPEMSHDEKVKDQIRRLAADMKIKDPWTYRELVKKHPWLKEEEELPPFT